MSTSDELNRRMARRFNLEEEYDKIKELDDPEEQGYRSGPLICQAGTDAHPDLPRELVITIILRNAQSHPMGGENNIARDAGLTRWCLEQLNKGANDEHADS